MDTILLQIDFSNILHSAETWIMGNGVNLALTLVALFISLKIYSMLINRLVKSYLAKSKMNSPENEHSGIEKRMDTLKGILKQIGLTAIWITFILSILDQLGINLAPLLASAGIVGLAIGFGSQELVKDIISGFFNLWENVLRIGDYVVINGTGGSVENISLRTTTLRDANGSVHVFQNGRIDTLSNQTKDWSAMLIDIGVAYDSDLKKVTETMENISQELAKDPVYGSKMLDRGNVLGLNNFGDSSLDIRISLKTKPGEQWGIGRIYRERLKEAFDKEGIEMPFPQRAIHYIQKPV
jgi:moderate conductance mechanosensitive channel